MKVYRDEKLERIIIDDDLEVFACEETGEVQNIFSRTGADFDEDEIAEEVANFQSAESEKFAFGNIKWSVVDKDWQL